MRRHVETLQKEKTELEKRLASPSSEATLPVYVCTSLVEHLQMEMSRGIEPRELLKDDAILGFAAKGYPDAQYIADPGFSFGPVIAWAKDYPTQLAKSFSTPQSQPGYQRVIITFPNGFYVTAVCHGTKIESYLVLDHPPGSS